MSSFPPMIMLFSDFGHDGPWLGQVEMMLHQHAPAVPSIRLLSDAPMWNPRSSAYLLSALTDTMPQDAVVLAVVDPGVGSAREPMAIIADGRWYIGPDNGLFAMVCRRAERYTCFSIQWRPERVSATFHGRDLFTPVAAWIASGRQDAAMLKIHDSHIGDAWPDDLYEIIYLDHYGNAMTGIRATAEVDGRELSISGQGLEQVNRFSDVPPGKPFWYKNSSGLVEVAMNRSSAAHALRIDVGTSVCWQEA